jgi:hypothetical protein
MTETLTGRRASLRIDEVDHCLVGSVGAAQPLSRALARSLPVEADRIAVVLPALTDDLLPELVQALRPWVPIRWESIRLVCSNAGRPGPSGIPAGQALADRLGVEVLAPDGDVLSVPNGSLFILRPEGNGPYRGSWWRFRPGREPQQLGRRFPEPEWERYLTGASELRLGDTRVGEARLDGPNTFVVDELPCGLWLRRPGLVDVEDLAFAVPMHATAVALVVSRAGDPPLLAADVRQVIADLPGGLYEHLVLVPYGDRPVAESPLGAVGSGAANQTLRVRTGLPVSTVDGFRQVTVDAAGEAAWRPFALELAWRPFGGARVHRWVAPASGLLGVGPAQFALNDRWLVEVVEAGLWIRPADQLDGADVVRELPVRARYCTVVVSARPERRDSPPWRAIRRLLRRLPSDARERIRVVVPEDSGVRMVRAASKIQARFTGGRCWILAPGGRLLPPTGAPVPRPEAPPVTPDPAPPREALPARQEPVPRREPVPAREARPVRRDPVRRPEAVRRDERVLDAGVPEAEPQDDATRLLSFLEELRRTPSWDEIPSWDEESSWDEEPSTEDTPLDRAPELEHEPGPEPAYEARHHAELARPEPPRPVPVPDGGSVGLDPSAWTVHVPEAFAPVPRSCDEASRGDEAYRGVA